MALTVRYPGRVCLLGEHCDWAGGASLAAPMPLGIELTVEPATTGLVARSELAGRLLEARWPVEGATDADGGPLRFVGAAAAVLRDRGLALPPAEVWIESDLPAGRGFSSSAAVSLAALDGLARHAGASLPAADLAELAFEVEHERLGVPCGRLDPLACAAGTPSFFQWRGGRSPLRRVSVHTPAHLVVGALGRPRDTSGILSALHHAFFDDAGPTGAAVRALLLAGSHGAEAGCLALERGDLSALGAAMDSAQVAYDRAAAGLPALRAPLLSRACSALRHAGALGAKFSGAGGDGSVVALFADADGASDGHAALHRLGVTPWSYVVERP